MVLVVVTALLFLSRNGFADDLPKEKERGKEGSRRIEKEKMKKEPGELSGFVLLKEWDRFNLHRLQYQAPTGDVYEKDCHDLKHVIEISL